MVTWSRSVWQLPRDNPTALTTIKPQERLPAMTSGLEERSAGTPFIYLFTYFYWLAGCRLICLYSCFFSWGLFSLSSSPSLLFSSIFLWTYLIVYLNLVFVFYFFFPFSLFLLLLWLLQLNHNHYHRYYLSLSSICILTIITTIFTYHNTAQIIIIFFHTTIQQIGTKEKKSEEKQDENECSWDRTVAGAARPEPRVASQWPSRLNVFLQHQPSQLLRVWKCF